MRYRQFGEKPLIAVLLCALLAAGLTGCVVAAPPRQSEAAPESASPAPTRTPLVTPLAAAATTPVPTVDSGALNAAELFLDQPFKADLDGDGREDSIVLRPSTSEDGYRDTVELGYKFGESELTIPMTEGYFISAFVFTGGWGNCGILVSVDLASDDYSTVGYRFNGGKVQFSCEEYGLVEKTEGNLITIGGVVDVIGTHLASREYDLSPNFDLSPAGDGLWHLNAGEGELVVSRELSVELTENGKSTAATLVPGTKLTLTATDEKSFALFTLSDGREGKISFVLSDYATTIIDGLEDCEWFESVRYYG